jgi:glycyl-tRNA synthetase beta chain
MVMADDPAVRSNRLNLLAVLRNQASVLADFSRLSG